MPDEEIQETTLPGKETSRNWVMYFDGAFSLQGASAGVLLVAPIGEHLKYVIQMHFPTDISTNNTTEYEGLLAGLRIAADLGIKKLIVRGDSQLVVRQVNKDYQSPFLEWRTTSPTTCQNALPSNYLWNQVLLCFS